jgi:signal peptidase I
VILNRPHLLREIIELIVLTLVVLFFVRFIVHGYHVQEPNMQPAIAADSYLMVNHTAYLFQKPQRGDIVVLHYPPNVNMDVIGRIIAVPGDTVRLDSTHVFINGTLLHEGYVTTPFNPVARQWKIPANDYFIMNDNRTIVDDSRTWGPVSQSYIVGKAAIIFWPIPSWKFL